MVFNDEELNGFRDDFKKTVADLEEKYQVKIDIGNITIGTHNFTTKMTVSKNEPGLEKELFERYCNRYGFKPEDYNFEFKTSKMHFRHTGFDLKSPKNNCIILNVKTGVDYQCNDSYIKKFSQKI